jgi:ABC-2 type transport system permease protein
MLSAVVSTMQQAMLYAFVIMMPFALLSGLTTPITSMPEFLQSVMVINPLRYALDITKRVYLEDAGYSQLLSDFVALGVIGLVTLAAAAWLFRRRLT